MGRTWEAIDLHRLDTPCVIKEFLPLQQGKAAIEKATQLFREEAIRLRDLGKHPQIPDLLAFVEQEGKLYLVQEFIEGETLLQEMDRNGRFSEEQVKAVLDDLLPVLEFVHQQQTIHRDIKPDNIMRSPSGQLVLIDFGVSKQTSSSLLSRVVTVAGTPGYAPIEQTRGFCYPASDLYSLGVTCIRLLTGCLPTEKNGSLIDELFDCIKWRWLWRSQLQKQGQKISPTLDAVLDKLLLDVPGDRYQSAGEVIKALKLGQRQESKPLQNQLKQKYQHLQNPFDRQVSQPEAEKRQHHHIGHIFNPEPAKNRPASSVPLESAKGIDYTRLRDLLAAGKWQEADRETSKQMLEAIGKQCWWDVGKKDIDNFPCKDLHTIDRLWVFHSNGRFGFSVQKHIYESLGGTREYNQKTWEAFGDRVGWRKYGKWLFYSDLSFVGTAPPAHLPELGSGGVLRVSSLARRLTACEIASS